MQPDESVPRAAQEQMEQLEDLIRQAREKGIRTGLRSDELHDLNEEEAAELIEQLQRRLGEAGG